MMDILDYCGTEMNHAIIFLTSIIMLVCHGKVQKESDRYVHSTIMNLKDYVGMTIAGKQVRGMSSVLLASIPLTLQTENMSLVPRYRIRQ